MRVYRIPSPAHTLSLALILFALPPGRARAQDESDPLPASEHPSADSPEAVSAAALRSTAGRKRAQAFLIPLDEQARGPTGRVAQALERALAGARQYEVVDLAKALASDAEPAQEERAAQGKKLLEEANHSFAAHAYSEAVVKYKAALRGLAAGLAALEPRDLADAFLRLAAAQQLSNEPKEVKAARDAYLTAALLDPQQKLQATQIDPIAEQPLLIARNDLEQIPIGKLELETRPGGARVLVDGQPQGVTPTVVELTGGKHFLRLERTGFYPTAELVEVASRRDTLYSVTLSATPGAATLNQLIAGAADEASHGRAGEKAEALASRFRLDRVLVGSVSSHGIKVSVLLALADPNAGQLLGREEMLLTADGTDSDQVEFETTEAARKLFLVDESSRGSAPAAHDALPPFPNAGPSADATAPIADDSRRAVMPGGSTPAPPPPEPAPSADDPGLVGHERRPVAPLTQSPAPSDAPTPSDTPATAQATPAPDASAAATKQTKKKKKDLHGKSGTESWDSE